MIVRGPICLVVLLGVTLLASAVQAEELTRYAMKGMVLRVDTSHKSFIVSHDSVPGVMAAMAMSFDVSDPKDLVGVTAGAMVAFTLVVGQASVHAEQIKVLSYQGNEQDPLTAQRLTLLKAMARPKAPTTTAVAVGQSVPDFKLIDQVGQPVALTQFRGKVVAINFIYTSCALPQFCFRIANNFGVVEKRFEEQAGKDLILLTVTFDPVRDQPDRLAEYAAQWHVSPLIWHFLTGSVADIRGVCDLFGVEFFPEEGLMNHSSHTIIVDRQGKLMANIEGNQFTAAELGDLVGATLAR